MNIYDISAMQDFIRTCEDGYLQNWHERNGGNLTYRMGVNEIDQCKRFFNSEAGPWNAMGVKADNLGGEFFIATGSGKFFRNVPLKPQDNLCILEINPTGDSWRIVWGLEQGGRPTSEFPSHFMNHSVRKSVTNGSCRVIYHAHPTNIIVLTYILPLTARDFSRTLWQSATECPVVFPNGVGVVQWMVPGGVDIALATCNQMRDFDVVVWAHHGLFCAGPDFTTTFGLMHTIEKAAEIYVSILSTGKTILQTITDENLRAIAKEFSVNLNENFLN